MNDPNARPAVYEFGAFRLEPQHRALAHLDGRRVEIAAKAFDALLYLVEHAGAVVTRDELMKTLWPRTIVEDNSLNKLIAAVRRALGAEHYIATLQGRGYQFVADVRVLPAHGDAAPANAAVGVVGGGAAESSSTERRKTWVQRPVLKYGLATAVALVLGAVLVVPNGGDRLGAVVRVSPVTTYPGDELSPSLSPDGTRVAFSWAGQNGNRDIYVALIDGSGLQRLTDAPEPDTEPAWSPDGTRIAFLRRVAPTRRDVFLVPALGGSEQHVRSIADARFVPNQNLGAPLLAWSSDGKRLVFAAGRDGHEGIGATAIYAISPSTGELTQLTSGDTGYDSSPAMSPEGGWLAFRREPTNVDPLGGRVFVQRLGPGLELIGEPTPVPGTTRALFHSPSWSADGKYLIFVAGARILEWQLGAAAPRDVDNLSGVLGGRMGTGEVSALTLVRAGSSTRGVAAKIDRSVDIWGIPLDPATHAVTGPARVRFFSTQHEEQPRFSPDGSRVAFMSNRGGSLQIWIAEEDESNARQLTFIEGAGVYPYYPSWSPDGRRLVFYVTGQDGFQVHVVDADGGPPQRLFPGGGPAWGGDGEHLYVTEGQYVAERQQFTIARVSIEDRHRVPLFAGALPFESKDGRRLFYWRDGQPHVFMRSLDGNPADNPEERLVATVPGGIAPVEDGFFYVDVTAQNVPRAFRFYDYATRTVRDVAPAPPGTMGTGGLTVSRHGTELLYAAQESESGADLVLLEFELATNNRVN